MKKKNIISASIITTAALLIIFRLAANKSSFNEELKLVSEANTTIPVLTDTVRCEQQATDFTTNGTFTPSQEISITSESQGKVVSINSKIGEKVVSGQVIACIDNVVLKSQLKLAKFNLEKAEKDMKRIEQLSKDDAATHQDYENAKQVFVNAQSVYTSAKTDVEKTFIKTPFAGNITKRNIEIGSYLTPGSAVFDIVVINRLKFMAKLTVSEIEKVQKGQNVKVSVDAYPGSFYEGKVSAIVSTADVSKRYDVEVDVNNTTGKQIKPGMYGTVTFSCNSDAQNLLLPRVAIAGSIKNPEIFLVKGDSVILQKIDVTPLNDKFVVVKNGLKAGDIIVTSGQISLVNGSKIKRN